MKTNEIEEKLERDSVTIKEQILSLQNTIKKLKMENLTSSQNQNQSFQSNKIAEIRREVIPQERHHDDANDNGEEEEGEGNDNSPVLGNRRPEVKRNSNSNYYNNNDGEGDVMSFSFNNNGNQQMMNNQPIQNSKYNTNDYQRNYNTNVNPQGNYYGDNNMNINMKSNTNQKPFYTAASASNIINTPNTMINNNNENDKRYDLPSKRNFYQENIDKIRQEKELFQKMEKVKDQMHPQRIAIDRNNNKQEEDNHNNNDDDDESNESNESDEHTFDKVFMPNKNIRQIEEKYRNKDLYDISNTRNNAINNHNNINNNTNAFRKSNYEEYDAKCNIGSAKKKLESKYLRESDIEESSGNELQLEDLLKEPKKMVQTYKDPHQDKDDSLSLDDTIKKLQKQKFTIPKASPKCKTTTATATTSASKPTMIKKHNTNTNHAIKPATPMTTNRTNTQRPKSSQRLTHQKNMSSNYTTNNTTKHHTIATPGNITIPPTAIPTPSNSNQLKEIKSYQAEISTLKNTILKLKADNDKLKSSLLKERSQNAKYKELTEEIIRHYEKTKKPLNNNN